MPYKNSSISHTGGIKHVKKGQLKSLQQVNKKNNRDPHCVSTAKNAATSLALLIDVSNTFTKFALSSRDAVRKVHRIATSELTASALRAVVTNWPIAHAMVASVVPPKNKAILRALRCPILWVTPQLDLGIGIDYPQPERIGGDRIANAVACFQLYGAPAVVVDFGTAVTFDVLSEAGNYIGGVIAPGMAAFTEYLHNKTALLPYVILREPRSVLGKSNEEAMCSGAVIGYRGLVREILSQLQKEIFPQNKQLKIIATGGDAKLIGIPLFDVINQKLTLEGLRLLANRNFN